MGDSPAAKRAKKSSNATRSNVASLIGLTTVTPRAVAYVAVQVWIVAISFISHLWLFLIYATLIIAAFCSVQYKHLARRRRRLQSHGVLPRYHQLFRSDARPRWSSTCRRIACLVELVRSMTQSILVMELIHSQEGLWSCYWNRKSFVPSYWSIGIKIASSAQGTWKPSSFDRLDILFVANLECP